MEIKLIKLPHNDLNLIIKKHMSELEKFDEAYNRYKDLLFLNNKNGMLVFDNGNKVGYLLFKTDIFSITVTSIYVEPTLRNYGYEEVMIKSLYNYYKKPIGILVRESDQYLISTFKDMGYYSSQIPNKKLQELFSLYTKDFYKKIPYTKLIVNVNALYDNYSKNYNTAKRILKTYGIKPTKLQIASYIRSMDKVYDDYLNKKIDYKAFQTERYQRYLKDFGINADPLLCMRINNSAKTKYKKGIKRFLTTVGKRKHIILISDLHSDSLKSIKSELRFPNISKIYEYSDITYSEIKQTIRELRYRNIEEICYISDDMIDPFILRTGIDTFLVSDEKLKQEEFIFTKASNSIDDIIKYIIKK